MVSNSVDSLHFFCASMYCQGIFNFDFRFVRIFNESGTELTVFNDVPLPQFHPDLVAFFNKIPVFSDF